MKIRYILLFIMIAFLFAIASSCAILDSGEALRPPSAEDASPMQSVTDNILPAATLPLPAMIDYDSPDGFFVRISHYLPNGTERLPVAWNIKTGEVVVKPQTSLTVGELRLDSQDWSDGQLLYQGNGFTVEVTDNYDYIYTQFDGSEPIRFTDTAQEFILNGDAFPLNVPNTNSTIIFSMTESEHGFSVIYGMSNMVFGFMGTQYPSDENHSYFIRADFNIDDMSISWVEPQLLPDEISFLPDEVRIVGCEYLYVNDGMLYWGLIGSVVVLDLESNSYMLFDTEANVDTLMPGVERREREGYLPDHLIGYFGDYAVFYYDLYDKAGEAEYLMLFALHNGEFAGAYAARNTRRHVDGQSFVTYEEVTTYDSEGRLLGTYRMNV